MNTINTTSRNDLMRGKPRRRDATADRSLVRAARPLPKVLEQPSTPVSAPTSAGRRQIDQQRDHDPDDRNQAPLATPPMLDRGVPEQRGRQENETQHRPQRDVENPAEPVREQPQQHDHHARNAQRKQDHQARHGTLLLVLPESGAAGPRPRLRGPLQFKHVAFRIEQVDRRPFAFRTVARTGFTHANAVRLQMRRDRGFVVTLDAQADMVDIAAFNPGRRAAVAAQFSVDVHQVDQRRPCAQLEQPDARLIQLRRAAEHVAIETPRGRDIAHAQHHVVELAKPERNRHDGAPRSERSQVMLNDCRRAYLYNYQVGEEAWVDRTRCFQTLRQTDRGADTKSFAQGRSAFARHPGIAKRYPVSSVFAFAQLAERHWVPAFAGMTVDRMMPAACLFRVPPCPSTLPPCTTSSSTTASSTATSARTTTKSRT